MSRNDTTPHFVEKNFTISVSSDGTKTTAKVLVEGIFGQKAVAAEGKARRRKGEERNPELGYALAVSRAINALAEKETERTDRLVKDAFGE